ncbi:hypothetical protein, partial [Pseudomonas aeruginosa]
AAGHLVGDLADVGDVAVDVLGHRALLLGGADEASQASAELTRLAEQQRRLVNQFRV